MKQLIISLFFIQISVLGFSQLRVDLKTNKMPLFTQDGDTLSICRDSVLIFEAVVKDGVDTLKNNYFSWNFDDGQSEEGTDLDSLSHFYEEGGGYRLKVNVLTQDNRQIYRILPVRVAMRPNFSKTSDDIPEEHDGVCINSQVFLEGRAYPETWEDEPVYEHTEAVPVKIDDTHIYESILSFDEFPNGAVFSDGDIDSLELQIEHSNLGSLNIQLICPDGKAVNLKSPDASNTLFLGEPIDDDAQPDDVGIGYSYFWSPSASQNIPNTSSLPAIPAGDYLPDSPFSDLNGCPLNGDWKISISDNSAGDNGFVFSWSIIFNEDILPPAWTFRDTISRAADNADSYYLLNTYWLRPGTSEIGGSAVAFLGDTVMASATAKPDAYGNIAYTFHVINNWACPQDTSYNIKVEEPSFTASPASGQAELTVDFAATTSWGETFEWKLGDKQGEETGAEIQHIYEEKGDYTVIFYVTDKNECLDTDTLVIPVSLEPSSIENSQNVFTPNDDGTNDFFKLTVKGMAEIRLSVYNRWGELVYSSENEDEITDTGWDGRMPLTNLRASPGVYFYVLKGVGKDEIEYKETGTVHLFR